LPSDVSAPRRLHATSPELRDIVWSPDRSRIQDDKSADQDQKDETD
jgi:hypothetical protein